jgi:hypothetical protein
VMIGMQDGIRHMGCEFHLGGAVAAGLVSLKAWEKGGAFAGGARNDGASAELVEGGRDLGL